MVAWGAFWSSFLPLPTGMALGLLVALIIFAINQSFAASDWELAGVLRTEPRDKSYWTKVAGRTGVALMLAWATALGATLWMFGDTIENHQQLKRASRNAGIEKEYATKKADIVTRLINPIEEEIKAKRMERASWQRRLEVALTERDDARKRAAAERIEAGREADGGLPGYRTGQGPRWREAKRQEQEAHQIFENAINEIKNSESHLNVLGKGIDELAKVLEERNAAYQMHARELDIQKQHDPRWVPELDDPLMRYIALDEIKNDPMVGASAKQFHWLMTGVLFILELSFLFIKVSCAPASVYTVRLIARTRREAVEVSAKYARDVDVIRRSRPHTKLRVVGNDESVQEDQDNPDQEGDR